MLKNKSIKQVINIKLVIFLICGLNTIIHAQTYTGNLGITNNGFSIIPTFSFNSPAISTQMSWKKHDFSVEPDIRLAPDLTKGSMLLWFRYAPIHKGNFSLRVGIHPAVNWFPKNIVENGNDLKLYQLRRFLAWELAPNFKINKNLNAGVYYLQGNGLQVDGLQTSHFVNLYLGVSNIALNDQMNLSLTPAVYYLNIDKKAGTYFTANGSISHRKSPFSLQSTINKILETKITGGKDFLWNIALVYKIK
ncbi:MAG: hypothetical protein RIQ51_71 [Bacteroidota bacterium]|jgi:hypothetical protein